MFGYLLVNSKNEVVLVDGDQLFKNYLLDRINKELKSPAEASTSSGVYTDSNENILKNVGKRKTSTVEMPMREISYLFLPLISFFRGSKIATGDGMETIMSNNSKIQFRLLANNYVVLCVGNCEKKQREFLSYFELGLHVNLGPLLDLIDSELLPVRNGKNNVRLLLERHCRGFVKKLKTFIDVRRSMFYSQQLDTVFPLLRSICSQLHLFIGSNRCLLMSRGDIISSFNSTGNIKHLWRQLSMPDLHCVLDQLESLPSPPVDGEISQYWLRSSASLVPHFVDVIRCRLSDHLVLVCFSPAKEGGLIRKLVLLVMQLHRLANPTDLSSEITEIGKSVKDITTYLNDMVSHKIDQPWSQAESSFLRNPGKTAQFLTSVWDRTCGELQSSQSPPLSPTPSMRDRASTIFSLSSLKTAFSSLSLNSSFHSTANNNGRNRNQELPMKSEVLLAYFRRQVTTLLQELCSFSMREANQYKLTLFQDSMNRIFKSNHKKTVQQLAIGSLERESKLSSFLRPVDMRLDMIAYIFYSHEKLMSVSFANDDVKEDIPQVVCLCSSDVYAEVKGLSGKSYSIYQLCTKRTNEGDKGVEKLFNHFLKPKAKKKSEIPENITILAVFESYVHKQLAAKQVVFLATQLFSNVSDVSKFYC